jgi:6,7-dimethyl-8-ribityllumazine synthase
MGVNQTDDGKHRPRFEAGSGRVAIVSTRFNAKVVEPLEAGARETLQRRLGVEPTVVRVPGAWEIPMAAQALLESGEIDAIVAIGVVIRGDTYHFEIVADQSAAGLMNLAVRTGAIITNAILTVNTLEQALERAGGTLGNKGAEAAEAALEMLELRRDLDAR